MVFSSMVFLCVFLPVVFLLYTFLPGMRAKNGLLMIASICFYAYGEPVYVGLMLASIFINYFLARGIARYEKYKTILLAVAVVFNIGSLTFFKIGPVLPIGISFYTFQILSYVIDVYRQDVEVETNPGNILLYVSFFPQLIAGPIVEYRDIRVMLQNRKQVPTEVLEGIRRFQLGLAKKVLLANGVGKMADAVFQAKVGDLGTGTAWMGAIGYTLQIYYDFSGYSDMAIGLGHMFGFTFKENFDHPYLATSIRDFWRRWHISLSTWLKDYLYIPLGGNRKGKGRTLLNKIVVFFCTGFWHGGTWNFIVWGMMHGISLVVEDALGIRERGKERVKGGWKVIGWLYTMLLVVVAFVFFNAKNLGHAVGILGTMFWPRGGGNAEILASVGTPYWYGICIVSVLCLIPLHKVFKDRGFVRILSYVGTFVLWLICLMELANAGYNPFIYFRF